MANFYSYDDRNQDRAQTRLTLGAAGAIGLGVFLSIPNARRALGQQMVRGIHGLGKFVESRLFSGSLKNIREGVAPLRQAGAKLAVEESRLGLSFRSFDRLTGVDLTKQNRRAVGIRALQQQGWSSEDARLIFNASNRSYDILSNVSTNEMMAHPFYRRHIMPRLSPQRQADARQLYMDVAMARRASDQMRHVVSPEAYREANRLFSMHLREESNRNIVPGGWMSGYLNDRLLGSFGLDNLRLGKITSKGVLDELENILKIPDIRQNFSLAPDVGQERVLEILQQRMGNRALTQADIMAARGAYSLSLAGETGWRGIVEKLPTEIIGAGKKAYNLRPLMNMASAGWETLANNFVIPVAPGMGGLMPLKFMPWARGRARDFAGTFGAGTRQRELYEALPSGLRDQLFNDRGELLRDMHYIGNRVFGTAESGTGGGRVVNVVQLPDEINRWEARDVRFGFGSDFARIRSNPDFANAPRGNLRNWVGDGFLGRSMDALGLDRQGEPSKFGRAWSAVGKWLWPREEKYSGNPVNALRRVLEGSNEINDVESVLRGVRRHASVPGSIQPGQIFTEDVLDMVGLHPGLRKLVERNFSNDSIATALREIDAAVSMEALPNAEFFGADASDLFRGLHTKINARRFAQNDIGALSQGVVRNPDPSIINLRGLLGDPEQLKGFERMRDVFYEEIFYHIARSPNSTDAFNLMRLNVSQVQGLARPEQDALMANIWSLYNEKYLGATFLDQGTRSAEIADAIRDPGSDVGGILGSVLNRWHGGLTPWVNPHLDELEGVGSYLYATPMGRSFGEAIGDAFQGGTFDPIASYLFGETGQGMGRAVNPGPMYHMGYRLNQMLSGFGLGLPDADLQTAGSTFRNLFLKRVLPVFGAVESWKYLNFATASTIGFTPDMAIGNVRAHVALMGSWMSDRLGITPHSKALADLTPGLDDYWQPRDYDEQQRYLTEGYEPVRRGRWWLTGSRQPFVGDRIQYWSPSWYQLSQSNWQGADNVDLNTDDYWAHNWMPTPTHPFAPFMRVMDPYWWERKHAEDRPYVITGEMFEPNTLWGNIGNMTIGRLLKPERVMHPEYLPDGDNYPPEGSRYGGPSSIRVRFSQGGGYEVVQGGNAPHSGLGIGGFRSGGEGGFSGVDGGQTGPWTPMRGGDLVEEDFDDDDPMSPTTPYLQGRRAMEQYWDIAGIYGYGQRIGLGAIGARQSNIRGPVIQSPSRGYGYERRFWDRSLGGIPGELSEFWRRVIPHRDRNIDEYNPVPNNMADWMPGDDYFINYRRGDPYVKIPMGEARLPGEAYERIHDIDGYDSLTRVQILSDVAPWSNELKTELANVRAEISQDDPEVAAWKQKRVNEAVKRASQQKKLYRIRDYRFNQETEGRTYTVKSIIDPNTFIVEGDDHPIRLAGVRVSKERIANYITEHNIRVREGEDPVSAFYRTFGITPGSKIRTIMATKDNGQVSDDMLQTRRAAVFAGGGNVNRALIDMGVGVEKTGDVSAPGIIARYSTTDIIYGGMMEKLAHLDTPFHTKLWHVRSALEEYKRSQVYGTTAGDWAAPIKTYIRPTMDAIASRNLIWAPLTGAFVGSLFGKTVGAKKIGAIAGAVLAGQMSLRRIARETITGDKYIPERVQKRRDVEEYYDVLRYIKYTRLSEQYADAARQEEGTDVLRLADEQEEKGRVFKDEVAKLESRKRSIMLSEADMKWKKGKVRKINKEINNLIEVNRRELDIGPLSARALIYRDLARRTITGANIGDPLNDVMGGLPRYERELAMDIVAKGTAKEKKEFFSMLTRRQQAVLGPSLGISKNKIPQKETLQEYFRNHQLPDDTWAGWKEDFDLNDARIITAQEEGVTPMEMGIYPKNAMDAQFATRDVPIPVIYGRTPDISKTLDTLLKGSGVRDISIDLTLVPSTGGSRSDIEVELEHDRTEEVARMI